MISHSSLGKTVQNVSIVASNLLSIFSSSTLLILQRHIFQDALKLHVYHGQSRKGIQYLQQHNVVITTYQTLSSAWKKQNCNGISDALFSVEWHRVILDEGECSSYTPLIAQANYAQLMSSKMLRVSKPKHVVLSEQRGDGQSPVHPFRTNWQTLRVSSNFSTCIHTQISESLMRKFHVLGTRWTQKVSLGWRL